MERCYSYWFNHDINLYEENNLKLNGEDVTESNSEEFKECLSSLMNSYFMKDEELASLEFTNNPVITLDRDLLISTRRWIDNNYVETDYILDQMKKVENKENVVVVDNFRYKLLRNDDLFVNKFSEQLLAGLKPNTVFIGTTTDIYNTQHVTNWLSTLFGNVKRVSMSKSPNFKLLTTYGSLDIFTESPETYATKFDKLDDSKTKELWDYFTKKSNLVKLTNANPELNKVILRAIKDALEYFGIRTYHSLIRVSPKVRNIFKPYVRELRKTEDFSKAEDKVDYLLNYIIDVSKNKILSKLIKNLNLNGVIKQQQFPGVHGLLTYIKKENLYPTVIYKFNDELTELIYKFYDYFKENELSEEKLIKENDDEDWKLELMSHLPLSTHKNSNTNLGYPNENLNSNIDYVNRIRRYLLERGICFLSRDDSYEYKNLVRRNVDKLKVVVSHMKVPSASHYIFLDSYFKTKSGSNMMSNATLYTLTQGGNLVTFTMDMEYMLHNFKSLVSPLYINMNKLKLEKNDQSEINESLSKRSFGAYLRDCKKTYKDSSPDIFEMMDLQNKLEEYLTSKNIDTTRLKELKRTMKRSKAAIEVIRHSLLSKCRFRSYLIEKIMKRVPMRGSIVLGIDNKEYKLLDVGDDPFKFLSIKEVTPKTAEIAEVATSEESAVATSEEPAVLKPEVAAKENMMMETINNLKNKLGGGSVLLQDVEEGDKIITEISFIKDITKLEDPEKVENDIDIESIPIEVENIYSYDIEPENDCVNNFSTNDMSINYISLNKERETDRPKLSSVISGEIKERIKRNADEYERSVKEMEEMISRAMEKEEIEENEVTKELKDLKNTCEEYVELDRKLKNVDLEQIMREHRFKRTFFGI
ncbi:hypothetical protein MACK_000364 [Theileria orientalis]|uniref:Uncharacterized protein n=1 Tax=Theileria orientalis TaxID=68886 RepID=A0A976QUB0_THEOR|nr:hypothetical protein MACK_000364 [Theileria orientalis]